MLRISRRAGSLIESVIREINRVTLAAGAVRFAQLVAADARRSPRRLVAIAALALAIVGCGRFTPPGEPFTLLTAPPGTMVVNGEQTCWLGDSWAEGPLTEGRFGLTIQNVPVVWLAGFIGRRTGKDLAVYDPNGSLVAVTGRSYRIVGGYVGDGTLPGLSLPGVGDSAFFACGAVTQR